MGIMVIKESTDRRSIFASKRSIKLCNERKSMSWIRGKWNFLHCFFFLLWILSSKATDTPFHCDLRSQTAEEIHDSSSIQFSSLPPILYYTYIRHTLRVQDWKGKYLLSQLCGWWHSAPVSVANGVYHSVLFCIEREITPAHQSQSGWGTKSIPMMNKSEF